jgi:hypothetical protein
MGEPGLRALLRFPLQDMGIALHHHLWRVTQAIGCAGDIPCLIQVFTRPNISHEMWRQVDPAEAVDGVLEALGEGIATDSSALFGEKHVAGVGGGPKDPGTPEGQIFIETRLEIRREGKANLVDLALPSTDLEFLAPKIQLPLLIQGSGHNRAILYAKGPVAGQRQVS